MVLSFIPAVRFTVNMFAAGDRFARRCSGFFARSYYPAGQVYTINAAQFFAVAGLGVATLADAQNKIKEIENDCSLSGRFFMEIGKDSALSSAAVCVRVYDYSEEPEKDTLKGDAEGLAGVLHDLNKWVELSAFFASLPSDVSPEEWDRLREENKKYFTEYEREHWDSYAADRLRFWCPIPDAIRYDMEAMGCTFKKVVGLYKDMRDGLSWSDQGTKIKCFTPDGLEIGAYNARGRKTYILTLREGFNSPIHSPLWDCDDFNRFFKVSEPAGFSAGKLTEKKAGEWFRYLRALHEAQRDFIGSRNTAQLEACQRLEAAGFTFYRSGDNGSKIYICERRAIRCKATVTNAGKIWQDFEVIRKGAEDLFKF